jgi:hypothetical protein
VKVRIDGSATEYDFVLDTGAITMMDDRVAEELKIEKGATMGTPDETQKAYLTKKRVTVSMGGVGVEDFTIPIFDIGAAFDSDLEVDGFIGSDFLRFFRTTIDYQRKIITLSLDRTDRELPAEAYSMKISKPFPMRFPVAECSVNGLKKAQVMVDTGCRRGLVIPLAEMGEFEEHGQFIRSRGDIAKWPFTDAEYSYLGRVKTLQIGPLVVQNLPAVFAELPSNGSHLLLGEEFLSQFVVTIDYPEDRLILLPRQRVSMEANVFSTGLALTRNRDGRTSVVGYWEGSPAERAGLELGDELLKLNSRETGTMSLFEMTAILSDQTVETVDLLIRRDGREISITVQKEMLLPPLDGKQ